MTGTRSPAIIGVESSIAGWRFADAAGITYVYKPARSHGSVGRPKWLICMDLDFLDRKQTDLQGESMRQSLIKRIYFLIDFTWPGILAVFLIAQYGLVWIWAIVVLEWLQMMLAKRIAHISSSMYDWWKVALTSAGIIAGTLLIPVKSTPNELGIAVTALIVVIHFAVYMILSSLFRK